jgi:ketosteroid isomerase-like protein
MNTYEQATQEVKDAFDALCKGRVKAAVEAEREACAKVCEELVPDMSRTANDASVWDVATFDCAAAIRARGETK